MLDMGFLPALRRVVAALPRRRQTLLFSATLSEGVIRPRRGVHARRRARRMSRPQQVVAATVTHHVHHVAVERKRDVLTHILTQHGVDQALVFCKTKRGANRVGEDLERRGVRAGVIHGNKSQGARSRALDDFKTGRVRVLVATDIAARGLDIAQHAAGRQLRSAARRRGLRASRRADRSAPDSTGRAVSLVSASESGLLRQIQQVVAAPARARRGAHRQRDGEHTRAIESSAGPDARGSCAPGRRAAPRTGTAIGSSAEEDATPALVARSAPADRQPRNRPLSRCAAPPPVSTAAARRAGTEQAAQARTASRMPA